MSTKTIYAMLAIVAVIGGVVGVTGTMSQAYAFHESGFPNQGKCIQFANSFKGTADDEAVREFIDVVCKHK